MTVEVEKKAVDLGLLEEDDEFEEFPTKEWTGKNEDQPDVNVWEDNWDDDAVEDDFSVQLNMYSRKRPHSHSPPLRSPEPVAKKMCSRATPPASPARNSLNGASNTSNGHSSNGVTNGHTDGKDAGITSPSSSVEESPEPSQRGRRSTSRRGRDSSASSERSQPTRSSARLRSSRK